MAKQRKYDKDYLKLGFTSIVENGLTKLQCVKPLCNVVLSVEAMKPSKLKRHLESKHPQHAGKDLSFIQGNEASLKRQKLDYEGYFLQQNKALVEASNETAFAIAKQTKPNSIGETLVKPCVITMVKLVLGENCTKKIEQISLSDDTVKRRIAHMSLDVKQQVINEIKSSPFFAFQVDKSTDVALCAQLLVFVCYIHEHDIKNEFLFYTPLKTTTRSADVFETISTFFDTEGLEWNKVCGICTDGAPAMLGSKSGFQAKVKDKSPQEKKVFIVLHIVTLLPVTHYLVKCTTVNSRLFKVFCKDMSSDHEVLLFYWAVRWLSKGSVVSRVFELREELKDFLRLTGQKTIVAALNNEECSKRLAYLSDVFGHLNKLNLKLQGPKLNFITFKDSLCGFIAQLQNWRRKVNLGNIAMFENLSDLHDSGIGPTEQLKSEISEHLHALEKELGSLLSRCCGRTRKQTDKKPFFASF